MPENEFYSKSKKHIDEIDLGKIFSLLFQSLKRIFIILFRFLFHFLDLVVAKFKFIIFLTLLGGVLGLTYFFLTKPYYESNMTLASDYFKGELLNNSIQNLNSVCQENNSKLLARLLDIPVGQAQHIKSVNVNPLLSENYKMLIEFYQEDEKYKGKLDSLFIYNNESTYKLSVEVYDTVALRGLDTILVNYIKNNDYVSKRITVDRTNLDSLKSKLNRESKKLDGLKKSMEANLSTGTEAGRNGTNNVILGEKSINPIDIYREDLAIYNQRQEIDRALALNAEIEIIDRFIPYAEPKTGGIIKNFIKGIIGGFILALLLIIYQLLKSGLTKLRYTLETT